MITWMRCQVVDDPLLRFTFLALTIRSDASIVFSSCWCLANVLQQKPGFEVLKRCFCGCSYLHVVSGWLSPRSVQNNQWSKLASPCTMAFVEPFTSCTPPELRICEIPLNTGSRKGFWHCSKQMEKCWLMQVKPWEKRGLPMEIAWHHLLWCGGNSSSVKRLLHRVRQTHASSTARLLLSWPMALSLLGVAITMAVTTAQLKKAWSMYATLPRLTRPLGPSWPTERWSSGETMLGTALRRKINWRTSSWSKVPLTVCLCCSLVGWLWCVLELPGSWGW